MLPSYLRRHGDAIELTVRVSTRSSKPGIGSARGDALVARVKAPPADGRANGELLRMIAKRLHIPWTSLELVRGAAARTKVIRVPDLAAEQVAERLDADG